MRKKLWLIGLGLSGLLVSHQALAAVTTYQSRAGFLGAISGAPQVTNFDATASNTPYTSNSPASPGFSLTANSSGPVTPFVQGDFWTTSGTQYLGLNNFDGQFLGGDSLTFTLSGSVRAFGLYVITGRDVIAGDLSLTRGTDSVLNSGSPDLSDGNGSFAYFLGMTSDADFGSFTLNFGDGSFLFTAAVDDVTLGGAGGNNGGPTTVPEPSTLALMGLAAMLAAASSKRTRKSESLSKPEEQAT